MVLGRVQCVCVCLFLSPCLGLLSVSEDLFGKCPRGAEGGGQIQTEGAAGAALLPSHNPPATLFSRSHHF